MDHEIDDESSPPQRVSIQGPCAEIWEGRGHLRLNYDNAAFEAYPNG